MFERLGFGRHLVVDGAATVSMDVRASERLLVDIVREGAAYDGRAGHEELAGTPHHHGEVRRGHAGGPQASDGTQSRRHYGNERKEIDGDVPIRVGGHVRAPERGGGLDASAPA